MTNTRRVKTMTTPHKKLVKILRPAYRCSSFDGACKGTATWRPKCGYVPRGFIGASRGLDEVKVVILLSEPGSPYPTESYKGPKKLKQTCEHTIEALEGGRDRFHRKLKCLLNLLFPGLPLNRQLRKVWITQTYLCSAPTESGRVPKASENECARRYLSKQLKLLRGKPVIALGKGKAHRRALSVMPDMGNLKDALHPSARKSKAEFEQSYGDAAVWAQAKFESAD